MTLRLAGVAQRPLRADVAAPKGEGAPSLFGVTYLTPADVRGEQPDPSDDVFRLASMIWRWRHGRDRLASMSLVDRLSALAGAAGPPLDGIRTAGSPKDELDDVLLRCLAPRPDRRAAIGELQDALGDVGSAW